MKLDPTLDGIDHINIYSKGRTELGRMLSNFAHSPFTHPEYGSFTSIEGFWYWMKTGKKHDTLRTLYGFKAKDVGKKLDTVQCDEFNDEIIEAIRCKLRQNRNILRLLTESYLPFEHYYWYGDVHNPKVYNLPQYKWMIDEINRIRTICKEVWNK